MKAYQIVMKKDDTAQVDLYGEVVDSVPVDFWSGKPVDGQFISLDQFLNDLDRLKNMKTVTFRINSVGGDANAGVAIYNRIRELEGETTTIVDGLAASAASIIAQAGDKRIMNIGTQMMIHGASSFLFGYYNEGELMKTKKMLSAVNKSIAEIYADRSGGEVDQILTMMKSDKWMTPDEAVELGFADEVWGRDAPEAEEIQDAVIVNGITHHLHGIPLPKMAYRETTATMPVAEGNTEGGIDMGLEELKEKYPDLIDKIREEVSTKTDVAINEALEADRERMKAIDSIAAMVGDDELVKKAKYDEPITAEQLALVAMQTQAKQAQAFAKARKSELKPSDEVTPSPVDGSEEDARAKDIADGAALIAGADWKGGN